MKKLLSALFISAGLCFATLPAGVQWDVASTGSDTNGGGFVSGASGTDFSQQDAAQITFTDLVIGVTTTQLTSVLNPFGSTHPGNLINITGGSGCTTGWYSISSVATVTATMDRSVGTAASTCTGKLGGRLATLGQAHTNLKSSNIVWFKGTQTFTSAITFGAQEDTSAVTTGPTQYVGYTSTHGDGGLATVTTSTNSTKLFILNAESGILFKNITFSNTAGTRANCVDGGGAGTQGIEIFDHDVFDGCQIAIDGDAATIFPIGFLVVQNTTIKNSISHGIINSGTIFFIDSYMLNNGGTGILATSGAGPQFDPVIVTHSVFSGNAKNLDINHDDSAASSGFRMFYLDGVAVVNATGNSIDRNASTVWDTMIVRNTINYNNTGFGVRYKTQGFELNLSQANGYGSNTGGNFSNVTGTVPVTITAAPFTGAPDYSLNSTAGGGAALKGVGQPGTTTGIGTGHIDIGPLQSSGSGGGGQTSSPILQ